MGMPKTTTPRPRRSGGVRSVSKYPRLLRALSDLSKAHPCAKVTADDLVSLDRCCQPRDSLLRECQVRPRRVVSRRLGAGDQAERRVASAPLTPSIVGRSSRYFDVGATITDSRAAGESRPTRRVSQAWAVEAPGVR